MRERTARLRIAIACDAPPVSIAGLRSVSYGRNQTLRKSNVCARDPPCGGPQPAVKHGAGAVRRLEAEAGALSLPSRANLATTILNMSKEGSHEFDFIFGRWRVHNRKLVDLTDPLCEEWVEFEASSEALNGPDEARSSRPMPSQCEPSCGKTKTTFVGAQICA